ncbi:hypothetical protein DFR70_1338 [Nocardia tenerifensis]|uniref:Uncharacterized protein n=1 Tax=Nocardia tenerifensis TaxID=228006 RepID=A0A318JN09_9NOCA|nr:hypothetical protein DFR70_1338 [Nocardia tenerifensis]
MRGKTAGEDRSAAHAGMVVRGRQAARVHELALVEVVSRATVSERLLGNGFRFRGLTALPPVDRLARIRHALDELSCRFHVRTGLVAERP